MPNYMNRKRQPEKEKKEKVPTTTNFSLVLRESQVYLLNF